MNEFETPRYNNLGYKRWALYIFLSSIPLVGFILLLVWAFSDSENIHLKEWAKGKLFIALVVIIFVVAILFLFGGFAAIMAIVQNQ